jgi:hypothetical protein
MIRKTTLSDLLKNEENNSMMTITIASVPDRDKLVAELWYGPELWGEISQDTGELVLEIYPSSTHHFRQLKCEELILAVQQAKDKLLN